MEEFLTEHGGVIVSGIISLFTVVVIVIVAWAISNVDALSVTSLIGG